MQRTCPTCGSALRWRWWKTVGAPSVQVPPVGYYADVDGPNEGESFADYWERKTKEWKQELRSRILAAQGVPA